jgi:hypothetical protein
MLKRACLLGWLSIIVLAATATGCAGDLDEGPSVLTVQEGLTGCHAQASSAIPASGMYVLTSFGFTSSDDGIMSCGSYTHGGNWYYAASRQRYGCGARIEISANGKCVVAQTDDYGPDVCVEAAAASPIIDTSPLISQYLYGTRSAGWSDHMRVKVTKVAAGTPLGPRACGTGTPMPPPPPPPPPTGPAQCSSATLARKVASGTCVQSAADAAWYKCNDGAWAAGQTGCSDRFPWCSSATLGKSVAPRTCVEARSDRTWYQCGAAGAWQSPVANGAGPAGDCSSMFSP